MSLSSCRPAEPKRQVVLYTSCDDYLLRDIIPLFEKETGIHVLIVGDTEATKTTGLVQRLIDEKEHPRADVWWSNEPFGTVKLDGMGLLASYVPRIAVTDAEHWPPGLRAANATWYGFGLRARAVAYNEKRLSEDQLPTSVTDLAEPRWKGRIGMARPQFGTTRGQMGALLMELGEAGFRQWLTGLKNNGVRLYDGNSSVVRAIAGGEIDIGLTDTDDIAAGRHEGWPVEAAKIPGLLIPNTVGMVRGCPHGAEGQSLIDFLLGERVESILSATDAKLAPVRPRGLLKVEGGPPPPDYPAIEREVPKALRLWDDVFGH